MKTIKQKKYVEIRKFPRFSGSFHTWRSTIFIDQENSLSFNFLVFSKGKREAVKRFLFLKLLWDNLSVIEYELFLTLLSDKDAMLWSFLKFLNYVPKSILRRKILVATRLLLIEVPTRESYIGYRGMCIEIQKETRRLKKAKKFSGYIKSLSSRGKNSGEQGIEPYSPSPADFVDNIDQDSLWDRLLG